MNTANKKIQQLVGKLPEGHTLCVYSTGWWDVLDENEEEVKGGRVWLEEPLAGKVKKGNRQDKSANNDAVKWYHAGYLWIDPDGSWTIHNGKTDEQINHGSTLGEIMD